MNEETSLVPKNITPTQLFKERGLDPVLKAVEKKVGEFVPDVETAAGRKEIKSFAYKIAQSKTFIDKAGKSLVSDQKKEIKIIDNERKRARDFLEGLQQGVKKHYDAWEAVELAKIAEEERKVQFEADWDEARDEDVYFNEKRAFELEKIEFEEKQREKQEEEEAERLTKERLENEERIRREAGEKAKAESEERVRAAEEAAKKAEEDRIAAEKKAGEDKERAVEEAKEKAEAEARQKEDERLRKEAEEKAAAEKRAKHAKHRERIDKEALEDLGILGFDKEGAKMFVQAVANGAVRHISINY